MNNEQRLFLIQQVTEAIPKLSNFDLMTLAIQVSRMAHQTETEIQERLGENPTLTAAEIRRELGEE